jgi:hypothetical protein
MPYSCLLLLIVSEEQSRESLLLFVCFPLSTLLGCGTTRYIVPYYIVCLSLSLSLSAFTVVSSCHKTHTHVHTKGRNYAPLVSLAEEKVAKTRRGMRLSTLMVAFMISALFLLFTQFNHFSSDCDCRKNGGGK